MKKLVVVISILLSLSALIINDGSNKIDNENKKNSNSNVTSKKDKVEEREPSSIEIKLIRNNDRKGNVNYIINDTSISPEVQKFIVYFDYNGGTEEIESKEVIYREEYGHLPTPKKEGYTFEGWYLDKNFSKKIESTSLETIKSNHILYANYTANKYTITYDLNYLDNNLYSKLNDKSSWNNDFDIVMNDETFLDENIYKFIPNLENSSIKYAEDVKLEEGKTYTFSVYIKTNVEKDLLIGFSNELMSIKTNSSWQRFTKTFNANSNDYNEFNFSIGDSNIWNNDDTVEIYGLVLADGELNTNDVVKNYNDTLGGLDNPLRDGYVFDGWYTDFTFKEGVNQDTIVKSNKIYYAKWSPKLYKLEIDPNGGIYEENKSSITFTQGFETIKNLSKPKSSYKITYNLNGTNATSNKKEDIVNKQFKGFMDGDNLYDSDIYVFNKDSKLKATYDENVNVTLDSITKNNYTCFWNTKKDGSGNKYDSNSNITINSDITLYAICNSNAKFIRPIKTGCITSEYGDRIHPISNTKKFHSGIDMAGSDKDIYPIFDGVVAKTGNNSSMGNYIIIHHTMNGKNYTSAYYHLELKYVKKNDSVSQDTIIGKMGQTGAATGVHLHLTMYEGHLYNETTKMVNPRDYINFPNNLYSYWQSRE